MKGWIKSIRQSKSLTFVAFTDGTSKDHQLTIKEGECEIDGELKVGASFEAEGKESKTPRGFDEFVGSKVKIIGSSDDDFPIQPKAHGFDFLRTIPEHRGRTKTFRAMWRIRHQLTQAVHHFFDEEGFVQYYTPIITPADCEGAGETFRVKSDWLEESLTVSGQLHGEVGMMSLGKIYTFSPTFRAEKSTTRKHLSEFWMIEPEVAFCSYDEIISLSTKLIRYCLKYVLEKCEKEFQDLEIDTAHIQKVLSESVWHRLYYKDIVQDYGLKFGEDISSELEKKIVEDCGGPVYITWYPSSLKPFYMKRKMSHIEKECALCFDLLFPEVGELVGGSIREESYDILKKQMEDGGLDMQKMDWYLQTRKWGSVPHAGFGMGFERLLMFITKAPKVHDVIPFPVSF